MMESGFGRLPSKAVVPLDALDVALAEVGYYLQALWVYGGKIAAEESIMKIPSLMVIEYIGKLLLFF